jgi:hypothetical protein
VQLIGEVGGEGFRTEGFETMVTGQKVRWVLDMMRGTEFAGRQINAYEVIDASETGAADVHDVVLREARRGDDRIDLAELKDQMLALGEAGHTMRLRLQVAPVRHVLFDTGEIEGFGWSCFTPADGPAPVNPATIAVAARRDGHEMSNEYLRIDVDPNDGTYAIATADGLRVAGCGRLVDGGDGGDTYNYSPPDVDVVVDRPDAVRVEAAETGPVRARIVIEAEYTWPAFAVGDDRACSRRSEESVSADVRTTLELRPGERFLRVAHEIDNRARDHRLRAHFPLPTRVEGSDAECAFAVVHRGLTAEGGAQEFGLPTFPSRRFVDASDGTTGLALIHDGLLEYEVVDDGHALALTVLRAVGFLSRLEPQLRPNPAGPTDALVGPQLLGPQRAEYAVLLHRGDWRAADCYGAADALLVPFERTRVPSHTDASRAPTGAALRIEGAEVSAVRRVPGGLVVRVFSTAAHTATVTLEHEGVAARGFVVDLRGTPISSFEGGLELRPFEIATLQLTVDS